MGRHSRKRRGASSDTPENPAAADGAPRGPGRQGPGPQDSSGPQGPPGPQRAPGPQRPQRAPQPPGRGPAQGNGLPPRGGPYGGPGAPYGPPRGGYGPGPGAPYGGGPGGTPRGGPGVDGTATPAHGSTVFGGPTTPPGGVPGVPRTRGGHPQHREPGGGWGSDGAGQGPPTGGFPRVGPPPAQGLPGPQGPRQDYLDAFDALDAFDDTAEDVFAAGAPDPRIPGQRRGRQPLLSQSGQPPSGGPRAGQAPSDDDEPYAPLAPISPAGGKGGKGRAFTGVAAAAVTTVLAVVVGAQIIGGDHDRDTRAAGGDADRAREDDGASRSDARPGPEGPEKPGRPGKPGAGPRTYEDKLAAVVPLEWSLKGPGTFTAASGRQQGAEGGQVLRYRVEVEKELPLDDKLFAQAVHTTLNDERSWAHADERSFERVPSGAADFVITLASPGTTGVWCAKSGLDTTEQNVSCDSAATKRIMINAYRWARGAKTFGDERIAEYRQMLINHEVGHRLGLDHVGCEKEGELAPIMMQQTKSLTSDGETCRPNAWPHPRK